MKKVIYLLGALFIVGTVSAQDSTFTKKITTTTKNSERVVKKKRNSQPLPVATERPLHSNDTINMSTDPVRREETEIKANTKIQDPAKQ